jgi:hypothetical protein
MSNYDPLESPLSLLPRETIQAWLIAAMTAEQELSTGSKVATASYAQGDGSRSVTYTPADLFRLRARIQELAAFLGVGRPGRRGPIRVLF